MSLHRSIILLQRHSLIPGGNYDEYEAAICIVHGSVRSPSIRGHGHPSFRPVACRHRRRLCRLRQHHLSRLFAGCDPRRRDDLQTRLRHGQLGIRDRPLTRIGLPHRIREQAVHRHGHCHPRSTGRHFAGRPSEQAVSGVSRLGRQCHSSPSGSPHQRHSRLSDPGVARRYGGRGLLHRRVRPGPLGRTDVPELRTWR